MGQRPLEVAATLGASELGPFFTVVLPLARPGFITAAILSFAPHGGRVWRGADAGRQHPWRHARGLGANLRPRRGLEYAQAHWLAGGMVVFAFVVLLCTGSTSRGASLPPCTLSLTIPDHVTPPIEVRLQLQRSGFVLDVDMQLPGRGITALFGPSGCGKTTCLRSHGRAGTRPGPGAASTAMCGKTTGCTAPHLAAPRTSAALGYVFQDSSLFHHLERARQHPLWLAPHPGRRTGVVAVEQLVELLGIGALMEPPARPRYRAASASVWPSPGALATSPQLLLMDEPLSALDAQRKAEVLPYLERLHSALDIPGGSTSAMRSTRLPDWPSHMVLLRSRPRAGQRPHRRTARPAGPAPGPGRCGGHGGHRHRDRHAPQDHITCVAFAGDSCCWSAPRPALRVTPSSCACRHAT